MKGLKSKQTPSHVRPKEFLVVTNNHVVSLSINDSHNEIAYRDRLKVSIYLKNRPWVYP